MLQHEKELDSVMQEIMTRWDVPGLAVGMVQDDEIVYAKGFGVQSLETQAPVTLDSVFCVQSISKCLVATAVMQFVERGKINLDAPIIQYLPYFQMDDERYRQITIRQIISVTRRGCLTWIGANTSNLCHTLNTMMPYRSAMCAV